MLCDSCCFISLFFFCTTCQTGISSLETCSDTTGWCLTQTIASKWNLLFSFYAKCLKGYGWKWNYFYCIPIVPQSTESAGVGFWPLAKTEKSFIFFSPLTLKFWCGNKILIKHGIKTITWRVICDVMMMCMVLYWSTSDKYPVKLLW